MAEQWMDRARGLRDELITRRRDFHRHPETAFEEFRTAGQVAATLGDLGLEVLTGVGKTGVVGILEGAKDGPTVLVRCDMDALPVTEANSTDYISQTPGKMHACGHDGHIAIGLIVAQMLCAQREQMAGRVKFVFQPAEEIAKGAVAMINDGALENPAPQVSLGLHLWNELPIGTVSITEGPAMAAANDLSLIVRGKGGHGAIPEQTIDPVLAGAQIVNALQSIVSRSVSAMDTAVLSICAFQAGHAHNVIPAEAVLKGTFRTYNQAVNDLVTRRIHEITQGVATAFGCTVEIEAVQLTPPLINDAQSNARLRRAFGVVAPEVKLIDNQRTMGSEDMACFLDRVPGTFFFVGSANAERGLNYAHHHPRFDFDEAAMPIGAGLLAAAVAEYVLSK